MYEREKTLALLKEYTKTDSLIKHAMAVEASMMGYAKKWAEPVEEWAAVGLLHDIDYEMYPDDHPLKGVDILTEAGFPEDFVTAVKGHADYTHTPRETKMAKTLYAVDELSGFVVAVALVRPEGFEGMKVKSVKKKLKDKAFARAVSREEIEKGAEELGVDMTEHLQTVIDSLRAREAELKEQGESLLS